MEAQSGGVKLLILFMAGAVLSIGVSASGDEGQAQPVAPGTILLEKLAHAYPPVAFQHKTHIEEAGKCGACHHHTGDSESAKCAQCHDIGRLDFSNAVVEGFLSCGSCHRKYSPEAPSVPDLQRAYHIQCFKCHAGEDPLDSPASCLKRCHRPVGDKGRKS